MSSGPATINTEPQEDCNWKGPSGVGADVGSALFSTAAAFTDTAAAAAVFDGIKLTKFEKPYSRVKNSKILPNPTTSCSCSKTPCLHVLVWRCRILYLKVLVSHALFCRGLFIDHWCSQCWLFVLPTSHVTRLLPSTVLVEDSGYAGYALRSGQKQLSTIRNITWTFALPKL